MVGVGGLLMMTVFVMGFIAFCQREKIMQYSCALKLMPLLLPLPFIANSVGWFIAEAGRQPWIVVGLQKTYDAVSPNLTGGEVFLTLVGFTGIYLFLAVLAIFAAVNFIRKTQITAEEG